MLNGLRRVRPGDDLAISAEAWNTVVDAVTDWAQGRKDQDKPQGRLIGCVEALALNSTGAALREYKPAKATAVGGYDLTQDVPAAVWNRRPLLTLGAPTADTDWVCVTMEAIPAGAIGRVAISGLCLCDVDSASGATWAKPQAGDTAALLGGTTGTVRVLHVPATGGSQRRCAVYLHERPGAGEACGNLPLTFTVQIGTSVTTAVVSGTTVVTGVTKRLRTVTVTADGCFELGEPYCEAADTSCTTGEIPNSPQWWCIEGQCTEVYDGTTPATFDAGPFASKSLCGDGCPPPPPPPGTISTSCCPDDLLPTALTVTIPSGANAGSWSAAWNGSSEWRREEAEPGPFITIACITGLWYITVAGDSVIATETSCDPLSITFTAGGVTCTVTE